MSAGLVLKEVATPSPPPAGFVRLFIDESDGDLYAQVSGGGVTKIATSAFDFTDLTDAPASYTSQGGKLLAVTVGEDGIEFVDVPVPEADDVPFDGTASGLAATDVQDAIDEIVAGLGTAAAEDVGAFATSAQGTLADTATQPADIADFVPATGFTAMVALTQAAYDALTPDSNTLYFITGA